MPPNGDNMLQIVDIMASGVHDAKNQLFLAESLIAAAEAEHRLDLGEVRYAIEAAATRLSRALSAYQLLRENGQLSLVPVIVGDLCEEIALGQQRHLAAQGVTLSVDNTVLDEWPLDRDLVSDMLNNAVQNAARSARSAICLSTAIDDEGMLLLRVEDDGPGFARLPPVPGIGLTVAQRLAELHHRRGRSGHLTLDNGGRLGGAIFEVRLP